MWRRITRRGKREVGMTEHDYICAIGSERAAVEFENGVLSQLKSSLPACAQDVLDGRGASAEYWSWLVTQWFAASVATALTQPSHIWEV